ncbi:MAG: hypothetical protein AABY64_01115 [Bdellovibrionota bacterium]
MFIKNRTLFLVLSISFFAVTLQAQDCPNGLNLVNVFTDVREANGWVFGRSDCTSRPRFGKYVVCCEGYKSPKPQAISPPPTGADSGKKVIAPPPKKGNPKQGNNTPPKKTPRPANGIAQFPNEGVEMQAGMTNLPNNAEQQEGAPPPSGNTPPPTAASSSQPSQTQQEGAQRPEANSPPAANSTPSPNVISSASSVCTKPFSFHFYTYEESENFYKTHIKDGCNMQGSDGGYSACCERNSSELSENELAICQEAEQGIAKCEEDKASAEKNCDPEQGEMAKWTQGLNVAAAGLRTVGQMSLQLACSGMSTAAGGMNAALVGFETMCNSNRNSCISSCGTVAKAFKKCPEAYSGYSALESSTSNVSDDLQKCKSYGSRVQAAQQNVAQVMGSIQASQQCAAFTAATSGGALCASNPFAPGCNGGPQNCDNPAFAASNMVCVCMKSPSDPRCLSTTSQATPTLENIGGGAAPLLNTAGGLSGLGTENSGTGLAPGALPMAGAGRAEIGEDPGGKKGSGAALNPNGGSNNDNGNSAGGGGGGIERNSQQVYSGTWGSGGGGGGSFGSRSGGGGTYSSNGTYRGPTDVNPYKPPNSKFSPGMSGMTGPDGVTGPNSTTIWQKVSNRYQVKTYSLKQKP